jgi:hypothetical protein
MSKYFYVDVVMRNDDVKRHIIMPTGDNSYITFPLGDFPDSPEMIAYLAWVDEGNTAEEWQPESEGN